MDIKKLFDIDDDSFKKDLQNYLNESPNNLYTKNVCLDRIKLMQKIVFEYYLRNDLLNILEKYPWVYSLTWIQFTPAFNDGDPCTFTFFLSEINNLPLDEFPCSEDESATLSFNLWNKTFNNYQSIEIDCKTWWDVDCDINATLDGFAKELFQINFGDSAEVCFTKRSPNPDAEFKFHVQDYYPEY